MPRWDPDKDLRPYEPLATAGTQFTRVLMDVGLARKEGLRVPKNHEGQSVLLWCLAVGRLQDPKHFVHGLTLRECFLRLRKQVKLGLPLSPELFPIMWRKKKKRGKK